jgi:Cu/Ag efflux pump CusA
MGGAEYMIRGLGYLRSLSDLETVPVATKNGTPVLVRNLGTVTSGPDIREGVAEWQGEGETVGGIVVMRDGMNGSQLKHDANALLLQTNRPSSMNRIVAEIGCFSFSSLLVQPVSTVLRKPPSLEWGIPHIAEWPEISWRGSECRLNATARVVIHSGPISN